MQIRQNTKTSQLPFLSASNLCLPNFLASPTTARDDFGFATIYSWCEDLCLVHDQRSTEYFVVISNNSVMLSDCLAATVVAQTSHSPRGITGHHQEEKKKAQYVTAFKNFG